MQFFEVGGYVRDRIMGRKSKDIDFAVSGVDTFDAMVTGLKKLGFEIFVESPEYYTVRARIPKSSMAAVMYGNLTADFVMCRKEGPYSDGRRPDYVEPGTIYDDLARRDFTMNAIAAFPGGSFIDPHNGIADINNRLIQCVGDPAERFEEDALRVLRAWRFAVTLDFEVENQTLQAMLRVDSADIAAVSVERRREELLKGFKASMNDALFYLNVLFEPDQREAIFSGGIWLMPTMKGA